MRKELLLLLCLLLCGSTARFAFGASALPSSRQLAGRQLTDPAILSDVRSKAHCDAWVDSVLRRMSLRERIGQLFIYTIAPQQDKANRALLRKVVEEYKVGGLLFSGGVLHNQVALTNEAQEMADVPLMITFDGEWGLAMRLKETPSFPRNMVLGCIREDSLLYAYGREVARQCREIGVQVNFAPVADININPNNPVINTRSFGESPENVSAKVIAYARGLEDGGVLSVCKHFPGHGDTDVDSHKALPLLPFTRERLDAVELYPFKRAVQAGLSGMMVGHLEVPALEPARGVPSSLSRNVVQGLLADELQFRGLIFTDALAMQGVSNKPNVCLQALLAGNDLLLVPRRLKEEVETIVEAVKNGVLSEKEIEAKCRKVLTYKYALQLHRKPFVRMSGLEQRLTTPYTSELISRLKEASVTLLRNTERVLPLDKGLKNVAVLHVGDKHSISPLLQTLTRYATPTVIPLEKDLSPVARESLRKKLSNYDRVLVCISGQQLAAYKSFFDEFTPSVPVVYLFFTPGKQLLSFEKAMRRSSTVMLAHTADAEVQRHVAKILYGEAAVEGRLSASIGKLFATGEGVSLTPHTSPLFVPEEYGMSSRILSRIDTIAREGIEKGAYPGCQIVILKDGKEMYAKAFGTHTGVTNGASTVYNRSVHMTDVYDTASLTKMAATLLAVMKLYDKGLLNLTDRASYYLPWLKDTDKKNITIRQLLLHESGLPATILFYREAIDEESYPDRLFSQRADALHNVRIGAKTWANPNFNFRDGLISNTKTKQCTLEVCKGMWLHGDFKDEYIRKIVETPLGSRRYRYSCVGFILLQQIVEARTGMPMDEFLQKEFYLPMSLTRTGYLPLRSGGNTVKALHDAPTVKALPAPYVDGRTYAIAEEDIVPSANDPFLRKSLLRGYVHDETAAFLGGVSGNAGLFSNALDVAQICQLILNGGVLNGKRYLSKETCRLFTSTVSAISRRGLGFDKPDTSNPDRSPCAPSAPAEVYGHTGFTGTCAWVDPVNALVYVFLCNRLYPEVWNTTLMTENIRTRIQEAMYESLQKSAK